MKRRVTVKVIGFFSIIIVCLALVYFLPRLGANKPPSPGPKRAITGPKTGPSPQEAQRRGKPQESPATGLVASDPIAQAEAALSDPEIYKRVEAVRSLRQESSHEAAALLAKFLNDPEKAVVNEALNALGAMGLKSENEVLRRQVLDLLLEKAQDKEYPFRGTALITSAMFGADDRTFQLIRDLIAEEGNKGIGVAVRALSFLAGPAIVPYLSEILNKTKDDEITRNAFTLLAQIGTTEALAMLSKGLSARREQEQVNSAWALSRKNDYASNALLIDAVGRNKLSESAIEVIASSPAAPAVLGAALNLNISNEDKIYLLNAISQYTIDASGSVRDQMAEVIKPMLKSSDPALKKAAIEALGKVGAKTDQSEALAAEFWSPDFMVRGAALEAFIPYCTPSTYKALKGLWYDKEERIRRTAFFLSEMFVNETDLPDLEKATAHTDQFIAKEAKVIIKNLQPEAQ